MGGPKALLPFRGTTFLAHGCRLYAAAGADPILAVLGAQAPRVRAEADLPDAVVVVVNDGWRDGMLSSIARGLDVAEARGAEAVLLHPIDHPLVGAPTLARVVQALAGGALIAVPAWNGRRGHPGGFARALFGEIRDAPPGEGARAVLRSRPERVVEVEGDPGCLAGIDTPEQYRSEIDLRAHGQR